MMAIFELFEYREILEHSRIFFSPLFGLWYMLVLFSCLRAATAASSFRGLTIISA